MEGWHITKEFVVGKSLQKSLKLVSTILYQVFIFSSNDSPIKTMKNAFYFI